MGFRTPLCNLYSADLLPEIPVMEEAFQYPTGNSAIFSPPKTKKRRSTFGNNFKTEEKVKITEAIDSTTKTKTLEVFIKVWNNSWPEREVSSAASIGSPKSRKIKFPFLKDKKVITKFLSSSVSKLHLTNSPLQLYRRASSSMQSFTKLFDSSRQQSASNLPDSDKTPSVKSGYTGSTQCIGKATWPLPWLEAIFLPEFPVKPIVTEADLAILNCIGSGAFGCVHRVCLKRNAEVLFALKIQEKSNILSRNVSRQVKSEASIYMSLSRCKFIAKCLACWQSRSRLFTLMQYSASDLYTLWCDYGPFSSKVVQIYAAEIALALDYFHRYDVIYRDLKLENVTLCLNGHVQIIDFGLAKRLADDETTSTICGTLQYMAPEVAQGRTYGKYVDWWSYGVLLHVLFTGHYPYPNRQVESHLQLRYDPYYLPDSNDPLSCFLKNLLSVNLEERICSFDKIRDHDFFHLLNWEAISERKLSPYSYIKEFQQCDNRNSIYNQPESYMEEETWNGFDENYEFEGRDFFDETM